MFHFITGLIFKLAWDDEAVLRIEKIETFFWQRLYFLLVFAGSA